MIFGDTPLDQAEGAILAHSLRGKGISFKKGRKLSAEDVAALEKAGVASVVAARLEPGDVGEDEAARRIAAAITGENLSASAPFTGRVNLFAEERGVAVIDRRIDALNRIHEAVTVATLPQWAQVEPKQMVATIKIIPFAVPGEVLERCEAAAKDGAPAIRVAPFRPHTIALIQTRLPGTKESVLDKTVEVMSARVAALGSRIGKELRCDHDAAALRAAIDDALAVGCDMALIAGASAITDRRDVIPAALTAAGGTVDHYGMPVDPGNLLLFGRHGPVPVVGLPGCARSPKFNGIDWVLQRLCADLPLTGADIMDLGIGGLLVEMPGRPQPRNQGEPAAEAPRAPRIAAVILAAGMSRRMGGINKLLAELDGTPMVRRVAEAVLASAARPVLAVVGHEAARVRTALDGLPLIFVDNPDYASGISASVRRGIAALPETADGALICLGDMPRIAAGDIDRLIAAFNPVEGRTICVPTRNGKRGNPVLIARRFFPEIQQISGDVGARHLLGQYPELVCEVEMSDDGVLLDVDTPQALEALGA